MSERDRHDCEWFDERLEPWLDGELEGQEALTLERHLRDCGHCRAQAELARRIGTELRSRADETCPERVVERLARESRPRRRRLYPALAAGLMAGAVALGVVWQMNRGPGPDRPSRSELAAARADLELALGYVAAAGRAAGRNVGNVLADETMQPIQSGLKMKVRIPVPRQAPNETVEIQS